MKVVFGFDELLHVEQDLSVMDVGVLPSRASPLRPTPGFCLIGY